jgi:hypothetical protein
MIKIKNNIGLIISMLLIVSGFLLLNESPDEDSTTIINVDKKTQIRIVDGVKYRCTLIDNK